MLENLKNYGNILNELYKDFKLIEKEFNSPGNMSLYYLNDIKENLESFKTKFDKEDPTKKLKTDMAALEKDIEQFQAELKQNNKSSSEKSQGEFCMVFPISQSLRNLSQVLSYNVKKDRCYVLLGQALKALEDGKMPAANGFLQQAKGIVQQKYTSAAYLKDPQHKALMKDLRDSYEAAFKAVDQPQTAIPLLQKGLESLEKAEKFIK